MNKVSKGKLNSKVDLIRTLEKLMDNSGESGEDSGSLSTTAFLAGSNIGGSYIMHSDDMEGEYY